jgi:hypothetical protein
LLGHTKEAYEALVKAKELKQNKAHSLRRKLMNNQIIAGNCEAMASRTADLPTVGS